MTKATERRDGYRIGPWKGAPGGLPLVVQPGRDADPGRLCAWLRENESWVQDRLTAHGALLLRGFGISDAPGFERVARAIAPELQNEYLGTSPRNGLTDHVFTASELPSYYPIPQHCEMSFIANPPARVFFCALVAPGRGMGETPLCDFRKVWRDLDPEVRKRFEEGGIRIVRNYSGPQGGGRFDFLKLKPWHEMFLTTDHAEVERKCREQGFEPTWLPNEGLRLVSTQPVYRDHPVTGERVWHNHVTTFHLSTAPAEYERIGRYRPSTENRVLRQFARALVAVLRRTRTSDEQSMHTTYLDGREMPEDDVAHVRDVVWRHLVVVPWEQGDVVAIDNHSTSHGRLPYRGPREIAVAWA